VSQSPHRPAQQPDRPADPPADPTPATPPSEDALLPELGIIEPGLDEEGILIDIYCRS